MEHIEEAGVHSGDSACAIPPYSLPQEVIDRLVEDSRQLAEALRVRGLMNVQYAVRRVEDPGNRAEDSQADAPPSALAPDPSTLSHEIYVLEVNPRASRTVPFVSKATGVSWARVAAKVMAGAVLADLGVEENIAPAHTSVKESVFPFNKFPGVDVILGPEMRSTGEVMGADDEFPIAFAKSQMAAGGPLPSGGNVFLSFRASDKHYAVDIARRLLDLGFRVYCTGGTHRRLAEHGVRVERMNKISEGRPNAVDLIKNGQIDLILNTPTQKGMNTDEGKLRATAVRFDVPMITTTTGAAAAVRAIAALRLGDWSVKALQDYYPAYATGADASVGV